MIAISGSVRAIAVLTTVVLFSACSVGGGGSPVGTPVNVAPGSGAASAARARVAVTLHIPAANAQSDARTVAASTRGGGRMRPKLISSAAQGLAVVLNDPTTGKADYEVDADISGANTTPGTTCSIDPTGGGRTCSIAVTEPVGTYDFTIATYAVVPSSGFAGQTALDAGNAGRYTLSAAAPTSIAVVLGGVVSAIELVVPASIDGFGASSTVVGVSAFDAAGQVIVSSAPYATPLALGVASSAGNAARLSVNGGAPAASVSSSAETDAIVLTYGGATAATAADTLTLTASASGVTSATATIAPLFVTASGPAIVAAVSPTLSFLTAGASDTLSIVEGAAYAGSFALVPDPANGCVSTPASATPTATSPLTFATAGGTASTTPPASLAATRGVAQLTVANGIYATPPAGCIYAISDQTGTTVRVTITSTPPGGSGGGTIPIGVPGALLYVTAYAQTRASTNAMADPVTKYPAVDPSILIYRLSDGTLYDIADSVLRQPLGVARDVAGDVFVADYAGANLTEYAPSAIGAYGQPATDAAYARYTEPGLTSPDGVAVDAKTGDVFVSDYKSGNILEFSVPYPPGSVPMLRPGRTRPNLAGGAILVGTYAVGGHPAGIAIDSQDDLYVAFPLAAAVSKYAPVIGRGQGATVTPLTPAASIGSNSQFAQPTTIQIGSDGTIYVLDTGTNPAIVAFAPSNLATAATTTSTFGTSAGAAFAVGASSTIDETAVANGVVQIYPGISATPFVGSPPGPSLTTGTAYVADAALSPAAPPASPAPSGPNLYVAELGNATMTVTPSTASGNVSPTRTLGGSATQIANDYGVAVDAAGNTYLSNLGGGVTVYPAGATGNVAPTETISGSGSGLGSPLGLAIDASSDLIVANFGNDSITEYAPGANGAATPLRTISGSNTGLNLPYGITLDASGNLYVVNDASQGGGTDSVTVYAPGASGNVAPLRTITGSATGMDGASYVAVDAAGKIYVTNGYVDSVTVYAAGANGNVAPIQTIAGSATTMGQPGGIAVDAAGNIYVGVYKNDDIAIFAPGSNGNVAPIRQIVGSASGINGPSQMVLAP